MQYNKMGENNSSVTVHQFLLLSPISFCTFLKRVRIYIFIFYNQVLEKSHSFYEVPIVSILSLHHYPFTFN